MLIQICLVEQVVLYKFSDKNVTVRLEFVIAQNVHQVIRMRGSSAEVTGANIGNMKTELIEQLLHITSLTSAHAWCRRSSSELAQTDGSRVRTNPVLSHGPGNELDIPIAYFSYENSPKRKQILERPKANTPILLRVCTIPLTR